MVGRGKRAAANGRERRARRQAGWSTDQQAIVDRLFVYGTLRNGQAARSLIAEHVVAARPGTIRGRMFALADGYPGFMPGADGLVIGELVQLRDLAAAFALLDAYEGEDFTRALEVVTLGAPEPGQAWAWCYVLARPSLAEGGELIAGGDWAEYLRGG